MDRGVAPRPCKICDWLWNLSWNHSSFHQGKHVRVTMEFEVPKRHVSKPTLSIDMIQKVLRWERQNKYFGRTRQGLMVKKYYYNDFASEFFFTWRPGGGEDKDKRRQKNDQTWILFFKTILFGHVLKIKNHIHVLVHGHSPCPTFSLHLVRDPKAL